MNRIARPAMHLITFSFLALALAGCPPFYGNINPDDTEYNEGYLDGFYTDAKYWEGFDDSYYTEPPDGPILYRGSEIPLLQDNSYEAGYYDGLWYAYNDGYFVSYDYGFTIGFSEGYDIGFHQDWYEFLMNDAHNEYDDGSFMDGYQDGFSEGSVFGAYDYRTGLSFDWEDAMWDYRSGTDLYIEEVGFGTGEILLYEYGTDPNSYYAEGKSLTQRSGSGCIRTPRAEGNVASRRVSANKTTEQPKQEAATDATISYRDLPYDVENNLDIRPEFSPRFETRALKLEESWLQRIERYRSARL